MKKLTYKEGLALAKQSLKNTIYRVCDFEETNDKFTYNVLSLEDLTLVEKNKTINKEIK